MKIDREKLFCLTPKNKNDYFVFFRWKIGRKLSWLILFLVYLLCILLLLLLLLSGVMKTDSDTPVFAYDSFFLKFYSGTAVIQDENQKTIYEGDVDGGKVSGKGTLFDAEGNILYEGEFADNQFEGEGTLYREGKVKEYEGEFLNSQCCGEGTYYGEDGKAVYSGQFRNGNVVYEELAGGTAKDASEKYSGSRIIYTDDREMYVVLSDIDAVYCATEKEDSLDDGWLIEGVYVLRSRFEYGDTRAGAVSEVEKILGQPAYSGTTKLFAGEIVAKAHAEERRAGDLEGAQTKKTMEEVYEITQCDQEPEMDIAVWENGGFRYTFFCLPGSDEYLFYLIETKS